MLYCPYLFHFEGALQKDLSVHLCGIQGCHISLSDLDFMHTREICFLSNSIKNCFNSTIQRKHYVFWPQEMCLLPLNTKHFTVRQYWSTETKNAGSCASASQTSPQSQQNFLHQLGKIPHMNQRDGACNIGQYLYKALRRLSSPPAPFLFSILLGLSGGAGPSLSSHTEVVSN